MAHDPAKKPKPKSTVSTSKIQVWEDDPASGVMTSASKPDVGKSPLAYKFPSPAPKPDSDPKTAAFRYWTAAEALRRGSDFWGPTIKSGKWHIGPKLKVFLDEGVDLNAYYDRVALNFFHGPSPKGTIYSGASPDILLHEMGHAILDTLKPELWDAASLEAAAFHESFGDQSAILCALQVKSLREAILKDTHGRIYRNSRLSRLAEELGNAIRAQHPDAVDKDSLRNAVNSFAYRDPQSLPSQAPATQLSSEPHSFSRVFTGAFYEALAGLLAVYAANPDVPTAKELLEVSVLMRDILVEGVTSASVVSNFFSEVAAGMVEAGNKREAKFAGALKAAFVRRSILSLESAAVVLDLAPAATSRAAMALTGRPPLDQVAIPGEHYGLKGPLIIDTPSHPRRIAAFSGAPTTRRSIEPPSAIAAATSFVDALFSNGRVEYHEAGIVGNALVGRRRLATHEVKAQDSGYRLSRRLFDCGICNR